jgi:hypothetical protein
MKLKIKRKGQSASLEEKDAKKATDLTKRLKKTSAIKRKAELKLERKELFKPALPRNALGSTPILPPATTVKLNIQGNRRGMHVANDSGEMKKIRAMRRIYNKQMPTPACDTCAFQSQCPSFKAGFECAFLPFLNAHSCDTVEDLIDNMENLITSNMRRAHQAAIMETLSGGVPSQELSESLNLLFFQLKELHKLRTENDQVNMQIETSDNSVIGKIFGSLDTLLGETKSAQANRIEVPSPYLLAEQTGDQRPNDPLKRFDNRVNEELIKEHSKEEAKLDS